MTLTPRFRFVPLVFALCGGLLLAGCESDEDKAERYYQSGLSLLEQGDEERALIEFRNVFKYDGFHKDARLIYANTVLDLGRLPEAYSQYLRLIEQYPDTVEARIRLAELAFDRGDWEEVERHGNAALDLAPEDPRVKAIGLALQYRAAALARDTQARRDTAADALALLDEVRESGAPDSNVLVQIVINDLLDLQDSDATLAFVDEALERRPQVQDLNMLKARLLAQNGDIEGTGAQLKKMVEMFPDDQNTQKALVNWYLTQKDMTGAEAFLRQLAGPDTGPTEGHMSVVQLLQAGQGPEAARAELERLKAANEGTDNGRLYSSMLAGMTFEAGDRDAGIAEMRATLEGAEPGEQTRDLQIILARMLEAAGQLEEASTIVDGVLAEDASNVDALKMQASWLIEEDKPGEAIVALRSALNQAPQDTQTLTLMAMAHERNGDIDLMGERLSLAVEVSGSAPEESMRYARFLMSQNRLPVAANVLEDARRAAPANIALLRMLAEIRLNTREWSLAQNIAKTLTDMGTPESLQLATELRARILQGQDRTADSLAVLEQQIGDADQTDARQTARAVVLIVQAQIQSGKIEAARTYLNEALAKSPDNPDLQLLDASLAAVMGETETAVTAYRSLIDRFPESDLPVRLLISLLTASDRTDEATEVLNDAIARMPDQPTLLWIKAGMLEGQGDFDGAIDVYETLYTKDSSNTIIANNLASLISAHRDDDASLQRAATISRRLRGTDVPAFQDTYGWIAYRRGDFDEALTYLEPAGDVLKTDGLVQYHLGMTYAALNRTEEARETLERALQLGGDSPLPQFQTARETLNGLGSAPAAAGD